MPNVSVKEELYNRLARRAAERRTTVDELVEPVLEHFAADELSADIGASAWAEERRRAFDEWMAIVRQRAGHYPEGFIVDDSREGIYAGRGE